LTSTFAGQRGFYHAPVVGSNMPPNMLIKAADGVAIKVDYPGFYADDLGTMDPIFVDCLPARGSLFAVGVTTVTCMATDSVGNVGRDSFKVTVVGDLKPPSYPPHNRTVHWESAPEVTCTPPSGTGFPLFVTTRVHCTSTTAGQGPVFFDVAPALAKSGPALYMATQGTERLVGAKLVGATFVHAFPDSPFAYARVVGTQTRGLLGDGVDSTSTKRDAMPVVQVPRSVLPSDVLRGRLISQMDVFDTGGVALLSDGRVAFWPKSADYTDVGVGELAADTFPGRITGVAAGGCTTSTAGCQTQTNRAHTFCVTVEHATAQVWCWGGGYQGQLGDGTTGAVALRLAPSPVVWKEEYGQTAFSVATHISVGVAHACVVMDNGASVWCWGYGLHGRLGYGSSSVNSGQGSSSSPRQVRWASGLSLDLQQYGSGAQASKPAVECGDSHSCVLSVNGTVHCWGLNSGQGQLGSGREITRERSVPDVGFGGSGTGNVWYQTQHVLTPFTIPGLTNIVKIRVSSGYSNGKSASCAISAAGKAYCWGYEDTELGLGVLGRYGVADGGSVYKAGTGSMTGGADIDGTYNSNRPGEVMAHYYLEPPGVQTARIIHTVTNVCVDAVGKGWKNTFKLPKMKVGQVKLIHRSGKITSSAGAGEETNFGATGRSSDLVLVKTGSRTTLLPTPEIVKASHIVSRGISPVFRHIQRVPMTRYSIEEPNGLDTRSDTEMTWDTRQAKIYTTMYTDSTLDAGDYSLMHQEAMVQQDVQDNALGACYDLVFSEEASADNSARSFNHISDIAMTMSSACASFTNGGVACWGSNTEGQLGYSRGSDTVGDAETTKVGTPATAPLVTFRGFPGFTAAPVLSGVPSPILAAAGTGSTSKVVNYTLPTAVDQLAREAVTVNCVPGPGSAFVAGVTTVNCVAADEYQNEAFHSFTVTVVADLDIDTYGSTSDPVTWQTGNEVSCFPPSGSRFTVMETKTVTCLSSVEGQASVTFDVVTQFNLKPRAVFIGQGGQKAQTTWGSKTLTTFVHTPQKQGNAFAGFGWGYQGGLGNGVYGTNFEPGHAQEIDLHSWKPSQLDPAATRGAQVLQFDNSGLGGIAYLSDGRVIYWGNDDLMHLPKESGLPLYEWPAGKFPAAITRVLAGGATSYLMGYPKKQSFWCVSLADISSYCWGYNHYNQLGNGVTGHVDQYQRMEEPVKMDWSNAPADERKITSWSGGFRHGCAVLNEKTVWCWGGQAQYGILGNGKNVADIPAGTDPEGELAGTTSASYGVVKPVRSWSVPLPAGTLVATPALSWGDAEAWCASRQCGHLVSIHSDAEQETVKKFMLTETTSEYPWIGGTSKLPAGESSCAGGACDYEWIDGTPMNYPDPVTTTNWNQNDAHPTYMHLYRGGHWGTYTSTQQGICRSGPLTKQCDPPVFSSVVAGYDFSCATTTGPTAADRKAYCWGKNTFGQLGIGSNVNKNEATEVAGGIDDVVEVVIAREEHGASACLIRGNGEAYCWGQNFNCVLGTAGAASTVYNADSAAPSKVVAHLHLGKSFTRIQNMDIGYGHACATFKNGAVACWGEGLAGQLGDGKETVTTACMEENASRGAQGSAVLAKLPYFDSPPTIAVPGNILVDAGTAASVAGATLNIVIPDSLDRANGATIKPVCVPALDTAFPVGVTKVVCTVTDVSGGVGEDSFFVTVLADLNQNTKAATVKGGIFGVATHSLFTSVTWPAASGISCSPPSGSSFKLLVTTIVTCVEEGGSSDDITFDVTPYLDDSYPTLHFGYTKIGGTFSSTTVLGTEAQGAKVCAAGYNYQGMLGDSLLHTATTERNSYEGQGLDSSKVGNAWVVQMDAYGRAGIALMSDGRVLFWPKQNAQYDVHEWPASAFPAAVTHVTAGYQSTHSHFCVRVATDVS
jgi:alpha-tubulin suppressor-like RCC1 family protein